MHLVRLLYSSRLQPGLGSDDIEHILRVAASNNAKECVTGALLFDSGKVMQCLEGARDTVNQLYALILRDPRHSDITILQYSEIQRREFAEWSMGFVELNPLTRPSILLHSPRAEFCPEGLSGESAHRMLLELREYIAPLSVSDLPEPEKV